MIELFRVLRFSQLLSLLFLLVTTQLLTVSCIPDESPSENSSSSADNDDDNDDDDNDNDDDDDDNDNDTNTTTTTNNVPEFNGGDSITALSTTVVRIDWTASTSTNLSGYRV